MTRHGVTVLVAALGAGIVVAAWRLPAAASPAAPPASAQVHVIRAGETVWGIARLHGVPPDALVRANGLVDPDRLRVGARIAIPGSGSDPAPATRSGRLRRPPMSWPSRGVVTSRFGVRGKLHHHGIDIAAPVGSPIRAARNGTVMFVGWQGGYGRLVILDHGDGLRTWYGHASKILVRVGQQVAKGDVIALVGTTGEVTGPNLHFEVRRNNIPLDPWPFLARQPL